MSSMKKSPKIWSNRWLSLWKFVVYIWLLDIVGCLEIIVIYEKSSAFWNIASIWDISEKFKNIVEWHSCEYWEVLNCFNAYENSTLVLDLTDRIETQFSVLKLCEERKIPHLVFDDKLNYTDKLTFSVIPSASHQINAFISVFRYFRWTQGLVVNDELKNSLEENLKNYLGNFYYLTLESGTNINEFVNRVITPLGVTLYCIFLSPIKSYKIQNALRSAKLLASGNGIVLDQKSGYECIIDGALIITAKGQEFCSTEEDYMKLSIESVISELLERIETESSLEILSQLNFLLGKDYSSKNFSLINIQEGKRIVVGEIASEKVSIFGNIIFPGNSTIIPKSEKKVLQLSIEAGSTNPTGPPTPFGLISGYGSFAARDVINEGDSGLLTNFQIEMFNFDCGALIYNATFANACYLKDKDKFGLGHISAWGSSMTIGSITSFNQFNFSFPIVGAANGDPNLSSTANFPTYMRVQVSNVYGYSLLPVFIKAFGFQKASVIYQNDSWGRTSYSYLNQSAKNHNMDFMNSESSRQIPADLDRNTIKNYINTLQEIIDSQTRILISLVEYPSIYYILEKFYDLGLRKGDLIILTSVAEIVPFTGYDNLYKYKLYETGVPIVTMFGQSWVGPLGAKAFTKISKVYGSQMSFYSCFYFDAAFLIAYALDYMINRGLDYTNSTKLNEIMRNQQFYGCTGEVTIEKGSNDRIIQAFEIFANKLDDTGNLVTYFVGQLRPQSTQLIKIDKPLVFGDGSITKPADIRTRDYTCPFPNRLVKTFAKGRALVFGICFTVALISLVITIYIWKRWWKISVTPLTAKEEISMQDFIVGATIVIEFFQFSSMGPDFSPINSTLANISNYFSLSLDSIFKLRNGIFWIIANAVFGSIGLWVILCLVVLLRLDEKFPNNFIFRNLDAFADYFMPILGDLCFIPFISICLDIFLCDQSIGDNFTDSFLAQDCYYFCWKDEHLAYAILSVFALIAYEPLAVFCRPLWQELQTLLHVKAVPLFLMVKTIVQITLVVMNKTVKRAESTTHGGLFIAVMVLYIIFLFKFKPYNYPRFSWWQTLISIAVVWLAFLSIIAQNIGGSPLILTSILVSGLIIIALIGVYVQHKKYPSLLFRKKGQDASNLFRFAFSFGKNSKIALSKILPSGTSMSSPRKVEDLSP
ncbi:unnamed protein product [Blepharisma stoltei]|uniref:Receptor ligand binding region domain-containing protein n=1 Tax=Blepharisma stoltei TaxID=1481888 RepID=A0AAU9K4V9_9CILI|nr:unnamed protein product [Blepharisma stoltei]